MKAKLQLALAALLSLCLIASAAQAEEKAEKKKKKREQYAATAMVTSGMAGGRTLQLDIYIDDYSTDEERSRLLQALIKGGSEALQKEMRKMNKGQVSVTGRTGTKLNYIRATPTETGRRIIMAMERPISFVELWQGTRSRDYEFGIIELLLDEKGQGSGVLLAAAKVRFVVEEKTVEIEHFGMHPVRLTNVRLWD